MASMQRKIGPLFTLFLVLFIVGVLALLNIGEDFLDFTAGSVKMAAQARPLSKEDTLKISRPATVKTETEPKYREFSITVPDAQQVELLADINGWGKYPVVLRGNGKGYFETTLVLSTGEYKYLFLVDGKEVLDPQNNDRRQVNGREVCIKTVK